MCVCVCGHKKLAPVKPATVDIFGGKKCGVTISRNLEKGTEQICSVSLRLVCFSLSETPEPFQKQLWAEHSFNYFTHLSK